VQRRRRQVVRIFRDGHPASGGRLACWAAELVVGGMTSASGPCRMTSCRKPHTDGVCKEDEVEAEDSTECPLCATDVLAKAGYADARSPSG
jgi:hypothetical protein